MTGFGYTARYFAGDMLAMILFLVVFLATRNIALAIALGVVIGVGQVVWSLARRRPVGALQWASLGLVAMFGGATLLTHEPRFIMIKPTLINLVIGGVMLKPGWMDRYVPDEVRLSVGPTLRVFGFVWAGLMFLTAGLNLGLVILGDPTIWARFNLYFPPISMIGLFAVQNLYMRSRRAMASYRVAAVHR